MFTLYIRGQCGRTKGENIVESVASMAEAIAYSELTEKAVYLIDLLINFRQDIPFDVQVTVYRGKFL